MATAAHALDIRSVDPTHVAAYQRDGWVKVPGLLAPNDAGRLLEAALRYERDARGSQASQRDLSMWREWRFVARDDGCEEFVAVAYAEAIGRDISELEGHGGGVRYWNDVLARKSPAEADIGSGATSWHQDFPAHPIDRVGGATVWVALDDVEADQGAMCFVSGSHREGPLGRTYSTGVVSGGKDLLEQCPWLGERHEISGPVELRAGDATFHHPLVVHSAGPNRTARPRWSFIVLYVSADAVYTGATYYGTDGLGLAPDALLDHPHFPVVWPGDAG
jgi:ectoine hydroxylase-related dioxygenase (phytanoyl-CoA dioxygenase family)